MRKCGGDIDTIAGNNLRVVADLFEYYGAARIRCFRPFATDGYPDVGAQSATITRSWCSKRSNTKAERDRTKLEMRTISYDRLAEEPYRP